MGANVRREVIQREYYPDMGGGQPKQMQNVAAQGQRGDTRLAHVNPWEEALLKKLGGAGTVNPKTGLKQFYTFFNNATSDQIGTIKNLTSNPTITGYNPTYASDLDTGFSSGKYSYEDALNALGILMNQANTPIPTVASPTTTTTDTGGGDESSSEETGGYDFNFPTDIMPKSESTGGSYSGLPESYRDQLLSSVMPQLNQAVAQMPQNIDKYVSEALSSYEQQRQNALRKSVPAALAQMANRGIISSTAGNEILSNVYSDSANEASTKGYQTAMQAALLKANMPEVLRAIADLGKYSSGSSSSYSEDPTQMYSILASMLSAQF